MNNSLAEKVLRLRWFIFIILALAYLFVYFHRLSLSIVADDLVKEYQTTAELMGLLGSIYFYCYAVMQLPAGLLSDSIGPRKTVTISLIIASIGSILFGFAPTIQMAFIGRILVGFGVSVVFIPTMKILSRWFRATEFAQMAGILTAVGGAGVLAATWLLALMTITLGWRFSFQIIGSITFLIAFLAWIIVRDKPEDKGWPSLREIDNTTGEDLAPPIQIGLIQGAKRVISEKHFWPIALWFFFDCGIFFGFGGLWGGPYLTHVYGMTKSEAGAILSMLAWGMIIGSPLIGVLSDKIIKSRKKLFISCNLILVGFFVVLYLYPQGLSKGALLFLFFIFSLSSSAVVIVGFTATKELFPVDIAGTSIGMVNFFPFLGGAVFMPLLGRVLDYYPKTPADKYPIEAYSTLILILLGASVASFICTLFVKETFNRDFS